jgi:hypothetical protein
MRLALLLITGAGSVLAYTAFALTINGQPSDRPFPGAVAVLQSSDQTRGDDVELTPVQEYVQVIHARFRAP